MDKQVPLAVIRRLPRYYRYLGDLIRADVERVSSQEWSARMGVTASQIRQDLNCFGGFGQQGYGYNVKALHKSIGRILGLDCGYKTIIVGAGNLGRALANHTNFELRGFKLQAIFDFDKSIIGTNVGNHIVKATAEMGEFVAKNEIDIGILALPAQAVAGVAAQLSSYGIKGLWNFSYSELKLAADVPVENVHLSDSLMSLSYKITQCKKME